MDSEYEAELEKVLFYMSPSLKIEADISEEDQSVLEIQQKNLKIAREKLEKLERTYESPDYRFFAIQGEVFLRLEKLDQAIESFSKSLRLKSEQSAVAEKLYKLHLDSNRIRPAFDYLRIYLSLKPDDKIARYQSIILASRLGERKYFQFALSKCKPESQEEKDKKEKEFQLYFKNKKFSKAKEILESMVINRPEEKQIHSRLRTVQNKINPQSDEMETILLNTAAIFHREKKYSMILGQYYLESKKNWKALNLFRRTFSQSLQQEKYDFDEETLYLIRNLYYTLGRTKDAIAISELVELGRRGDHQDEEELYTLYKKSLTREVLVYLLFHVRHKKKKELLEEVQSFLQDHDKKFADSEFMNIFPVFDFEINTE